MLLVFPPMPDDDLFMPLYFPVFIHFLVNHFVASAKISVDYLCRLKHAPSFSPSSFSPHFTHHLFLLSSVVPNYRMAYWSRVYLFDFLFFLTFPQNCLCMHIQINIYLYISSFYTAENFSQALHFFACTEFSQVWSHHVTLFLLPVSVFWFSFFHLRSLSFSFHSFLCFLAHSSAFLYPRC